MNAERAIAQEGTDEAPGREPDVAAEPTDGAGSVTGPHFGRDDRGRFDHRYWRCETCGFESVDPRLRRGCFRCSDGVGATSRRSTDAE